MDAWRAISRHYLVSIESVFLNEERGKAGRIPRGTGFAIPFQTFYRCRYLRTHPRTPADGATCSRPAFEKFQVVARMKPCGMRDHRSAELPGFRKLHPGYSLITTITTRCYLTTPAVLPICFDRSRPNCIKNWPDPGGESGS